MAPGERADASRGEPTASDWERPPQPLPRKVLLITYYWPPSGGPGVQRVLKFAKYLPEFGWRPLVLTVREDADYPVLDPSLAREVPPDARVYRSGIVEFYDLYRRITGKPKGESIDIQTVQREGGSWKERLLRTIRGSLFVPDGRAGWFRPGVALGRRILGEERPDVILASGPPFTTHWIGKALAEASGVPLVLDFRDPWTRATYYPVRPGWAKRIDERLEHGCLVAAAGVVTVNRQIRDDLLRRYADVDAGRFHLVPNGFDEADFAVCHPRYERPTIAHAGSVFASRVPHTFLRELGAWLRTSPVNCRWRLCLAGRLAPEMEAALDEHVPQDCVVRMGYLSHESSVELLQRSHLALLLTGQDDQSQGMLTGKVYEYLAARTPVLALAPTGGEAAELMRAEAAGWVIAPDDAQAIRHFLESIPDTLIDASPQGPPSPKYSRRTLTGRLANLLSATLRANG